MTTYSNPGHVSDVVGTTGRIEATWGNAIRDRTNGHFASTADRDTAFPTPNVGCVAFVDGSPPVRYEYDGTAWRAYDLGRQTYTPTLTQSVTVTKNVTTAWYIRHGASIEVWIQLAITGAGTSGVEIQVGLPVASAGLATGDNIGVGFYNDANVSARNVVAFNRGTVLGMRIDAGTICGVSPAFAAANGDSLALNLSYPIV